MEKDYNLYENIRKGYDSSPPFRTVSSLPLDLTKIPPSFVSPVKPEETVTEAVDAVIQINENESCKRLHEQWESPDFSR